MKITWIQSCLKMFSAGFIPDHPPKSIKFHAAGLILSLSAIGIYDSLFFNRYYPLSEGWFSVFAQFIEQGYLPYQDFHLFLTPLHQLVICGFVKIFGYAIIKLRILGLIMALIMTALVYLISAEFFIAPIALIGTTFGVIYYQSSVVFINYDFLQFFTIYALASCWLICSHFRTSNFRRTEIKNPASWRLIVAGVLAGMAFLTKQSNGLFVAFFLGLSVVLAAGISGYRHAMREGAIFTIGVSIPFLGVLLWLQHYDLWGPFVENCLQAGTSSKGGVTAIFLGWLPRLFAGGRLKGALAVIGLGILWVFETYWRSKRQKASILQANWSQSTFYVIIVTWMLFVSLMVCIFLPYSWVRFSYWIIGHLSLNRWWSLLALIGTFFASLMMLGSLLCVYKYKWRQSLPVLIVGTTCVGFFIGNGTSAAIDMAGVFLPISLLIGFVLTVPLPARWTKLGMSLLGGALLTHLCAQKYITPYIWWGLSQPDVRYTAPISDIPLLQGMKMSTGDGGFLYVNTVRGVNLYSKPGDTLYTFPHMPQFHLLTNRFPNTYAAVHWFDVASDDVALHDARTLRISPPKILIFLDVPEVVWREHERGFRNGNPCGQREIRRVLGELIDRGRYMLVFKRWVPDQNVLTLWVRNDEPRATRSTIHG